MRSCSSLASASPSWLKVSKLFLSSMMKRSKFINHAGSWRSKCVGSKQSSVSLQIQKGIVDLGLSTLIKLLLVPKVQLALKDEGLEFWGVGTSEWVGSQSFGL